MKNLIIILVWLVATFAVVGGAIFYLSSRCALFLPAVPKKVWIWGFVVLFFFLTTSFMVFTMIANPIFRPVNIFAIIAMALFLFMLMSVAFTDVLHLIFRFSPQIRGILSVGLAVLLTVYSIYNANNIKIKEITIPMKGLTQEIRAVLITDFHLGNYLGKRHVSKIVGKIKEISPDVVFNTGDMFDGRVHFNDGSDVLAAFRTLAAPHYFVYGNHDEMVGVQEVISQMKRANAIVLSNEIANFGELQIIGLGNMAADENSFDPHTRPGAATIKSVMARLPIEENRPTVVLHHRPDGVKYMHEKGADLLLAGHTHAGQIFPFSLFANLMFEYNRGLYKYETMNIYVSQGVITMLRLGTRSEITVLRLAPKTN